MFSLPSCVSRNFFNYCYMLVLTASTKTMGKIMRENRKVLYRTRPYFVLVDYHSVDFVLHDFFFPIVILGQERTDAHQSYFK